MLWMEGKSRSLTITTNGSRAAGSRVDLVMLCVADVGGVLGDGAGDDTAHTPLNGHVFMSYRMRSLSTPTKQVCLCIQGIVTQMTARLHCISSHIRSRSTSFKLDLRCWPLVEPRSTNLSVANTLST